MHIEAGRWRTDFEKGAEFTPGRESDHTDELDSDCEMLEDCSLSCIQMDINGMGAEESSGGFQFIF